MRKIKMNDLEVISAEQKKVIAGYKSMLMVCTGTGCVAARGFDIKDQLTGALEAAGLDKEHVVIGTGCNGFCAAGPIVVDQPSGTFYQKVKAKDIPELVEHVAAGTYSRAGPGPCSRGTAGAD